LGGGWAVNGCVSAQTYRWTCPLFGSGAWDKKKESMSKKDLRRGKLRTKHTWQKTSRKEKTEFPPGKRENCSTHQQQFGLFRKWWLEGRRTIVLVTRRGAEVEEKGPGFLTSER